GTSRKPVYAWHQFSRKIQELNRKRYQGSEMSELSLENVFHLLRTRDIPGTADELKMLRTRIGELVELNGNEWVIQNRQTLLEEWDYIVQTKIIK
ncbi:MAG: hypothetical protein PVF14_12860, partial [Desulfobacterales bacterium]